MNLSRIAVSLALALTGPVALAQLKAPRSGGPSLAAPPAAGTPVPAPTAPAEPAASGDEQSQKEAAGQVAALGWLLLLDRRDWGTAWESTSPVFRAQVPIATWMDAIPKVREPLGPLAERQPIEVGYKTALPGRPAGDYVTVVFASRFGNKPDTEEIVTTLREADGRWRVIGYSTR